MLINEADNSAVLKFLDKGIIAGAFIFALSTLTSKAGASIGLGLVGLLWLIRVLVTRNYQFKTTKLDKFILFFVGALFLSRIDTGLTVNFFDESSPYFFSIILYYGLINTIDNLEIIKKLVYTAAFSMLVSTGYGFYQKFYLETKVNGFSFTLSYGCLLAIFLMFAVAYFLWGGVNWRQRTALAALIGLMGANLLFTEARGAWLGFFGGGFSLAWLKDKRIIAGMLICLLIAFFLLPPSYISEFKSSFNITDNSSNLGRLALWKGSWLMFKDQPINGIGFGDFQETYLTKYKQPNTTNAKHAHNNFFHFLATTGILGLTAFCGLIIMILKLAFEAYQRLESQNWSLFFLGSLTAFIIFHIQGLTEFNFNDVETLRFFWFLTGLNIIAINQLIGRMKNEN